MTRTEARNLPIDEKIQWIRDEMKEFTVGKEGICRMDRFILIDRLRYIEIPDQVITRWFYRNSISIAKMLNDYPEFVVNNQQWLNELALWLHRDATGTQPKSDQWNFGLGGDV